MVAVFATKFDSRLQGFFVVLTAKMIALNAIIQGYIR